jgi:hypothetical protein
MNMHARNSKLGLYIYIFLLLTYITNVNLYAHFFVGFPRRRHTLHPSGLGISTMSSEK